MPQARVVALLSRPTDGAACPPGVDREAFAAALLEDGAELLERLERVRPMLLVSPPGRLDPAALPVWPGTTVAAGPVDGSAAPALAGLAGLGAEQAVVFAGDAPDLPALLIGKLFRALGSADVALCPAPEGLAAVGARLPLAGWVPVEALDLDRPDALDRVVAAAPRRRVVAVTPGWRRLRTPADLARLDPGLEGWEATGALLAGHRPAGGVRR